MIHIITGLPGAGKTIAANIIKQELIDSLLINTDELRNFLYPKSEVGDFDPEQMNIVYNLLPQFALCIKKIQPYKHIVFDGTFRYKSQRLSIFDIMKNTSQPVSVIWIKADVNIICERVILRFNSGTHLLDYKSFKKVLYSYEPPEEAWIIENTGSIEDLTLKIKQYLEKIKIAYTYNKYESINYVKKLEKKGQTYENNTI